MLNYKKKAFTITELVIVIAVVAILAAVLIPTFSNVVEKANQSADMQAVRNANTALANAEILDGKPASSIGEALAVVAQAGYNVESFTPSSNGDILWDEANNRFALVDEEGKVVLNDQAKPLEESRIVKKGENRTSLDVWMITDNKAEIESGRYSYYLKEGVTGDVTVKTGVDVGVNEDVNVIYSTSATQSVYIRTNGCKLTVDASGSDVHHHGTASEVVINSVKTESYHEYGTVETTITLKSGHVVLESTAVVPEIKVTGSVTVTNKTGKDVAITPADDNVGDVTVDGKEVFTVSFANEGKQVAKQLIVDGDKARDPELALEKTGYTFKGWYNGEIKFDFAKDVVTADTTLIAEWTPNEYTVTFVSEEVEVAPITVTYGEEYTLPTPIRTGYTFAGWVDSNDKPYGNGTWQGTSDLELTAKWTPITYEVTFVTERGTVNPQTVQHGKTATDPELTVDGYKLVGWFTADGNSYDFTTPVTQDITLTAKWGRVVAVTEDASTNGLKLQMAVKEWSDDIIYVPSGTYSLGAYDTGDTRISIRRDVQIIGIGETKPVIQYAGPVSNNLPVNGYPISLFQVLDESNVVFDNLVFENTGKTENVTYTAIWAGYADYLFDALLSEVYTGNLTVKNCEFVEFDRAGIAVNGTNETQVTVTDSKFIGTKFASAGVSLHGGVTATVTNNVFKSTTVGIHVKSDVAPTQTGNTFIDQGVVFDKVLSTYRADVYLAGESDDMFGHFVIVDGKMYSTFSGRDVDLAESDGAIFDACKNDVSGCSEIWIVNKYGQIAKNNGVERKIVKSADGWETKAPQNVYIASESGQNYYTANYSSTIMKFVADEGNFGTLEQGKVKSGINIIYVTGADGVVTNVYLKVGDQWMTRQQVVEGNILLVGDIKYGKEGNASYFDTNNVVDDGFNLVDGTTCYVQMQRTSETDTLRGRFAYMLDLLEGKDTVYVVDNSGNVLDTATKNADGTWKVTINFEGQTKSWTVTITGENSTSWVEIK